MYDLKTKLKNLNYEITKEPLVSKNTNYPTSEYGLFKNDIHLSTVKKNYRVMQNAELIDLLDTAISKINTVFDINKVRADILHNYRKIYIQLALPDKVVNNDTIRRNITVINSFDKTMAVGFGTTNTVISCENSMFLAYSDINHFKHTSNLDANLLKLIESLTNSINYELRLLKLYEVMANSNLNKSDIAVNMMYDYLNIDRRFIDSSKVDGQFLSSNKVNKLYDLQHSIIKELNAKGNNAWALLNGFTNYNTHVEKSIYSGKVELILDNILIESGLQPLDIQLQNG